MSEKNQPPTPKRIREARQEGQVARSKDLTQAVLLIALFGHMLYNAETILASFQELILMAEGVSAQHFGQAVGDLLQRLAIKAAEIMAPFLLIVVILGLGVEFTQTGMNFAPKALKPSGKRLDVVKNAMNIFSKRNLVEFIKTLIKVVLLTSILYVLLLKTIGPMTALPSAGIVAVAAGTGEILKALLIWVAVGYIVIAAADYAWQRHSFLSEIKMSREEVEREYKEMEGDPEIRMRRRQLYRELQNVDALQSTRQASVVITNPTHIAVAIAYQKKVTPLPVVLAMGEGGLAAAMIQIAKESQIPVLQDVPLARALFSTAKLNAFIPPELIEPVVNVLRFIDDMDQPTDAEHA